MDRRTFSKLALASTLLPCSNIYGAETVKKEGLVKAKKSVVMISLDYGFRAENFAPGDSLNTPYLSKLSSLHKKMTAFPDIEQPERLAGHTNHHSVFTCQSKFGKIREAFVSLDQLIAAKTIQMTRRKNAYIGPGKGSSYSYNMNGVSIPAILNTDDLYKYLFGETLSVTEIEKKYEAVKEFEKQLVSSKHNRFYRAMVEEKVSAVKTELKWANVTPPKIEYKLGSNGDQFSNISGFLNLIKHGLVEKQSPTYSYCISHNGNVQVKDVTMSYHGCSHFKNNTTDKYRQIQLIEKNVMGKLTTFLKDLEEKKILDDTIVLIAGNMGNPSHHSMKDMSVLLVGGGFDHKGIIRCKDKSGKLIHPLAKLYTSIMHQVGITSINSFAGVKGNMDELIL